MLQDLLDVVLPTACAGCDGVLRDQGRTRLCATCRTQVPTGLWPLPVAGLDAAWAWAPYDGPIGAALRRGKYRPDPAALQDLGRRLVPAALPLAGAADVVVPVPRAWTTLLSAGLEPARLLAAPLAESAGRPLTRPLRRRPGPQQAGVRTRERRVNVAGAFRAVTPLSRTRVLLVDDVITSGATAGACAAALRAAGARRVVLLAACSPLL